MRTGTDTLKFRQGSCNSRLVPASNPNRVAAALKCCSTSSWALRFLPARVMSPPPPLYSRAVTGFS